jgi:hypothetical protein
VAEKTRNFPKKILLKIPASEACNWQGGVAICIYMSFRQILEAINKKRRNNDKMWPD